MESLRIYAWKNTTNVREHCCPECSFKMEECTGMSPLGVAIFTPSALDQEIAEKTARRSTVGEVLQRNVSRMVPCVSDGYIPQDDIVVNC